MTHSCSSKVTQAENTMQRKYEPESIIHAAGVQVFLSCHPRPRREMPFTERKGCWQRSKMPSRAAWRAPNPRWRLLSDLGKHGRRRRRKPRKRCSVVCFSIGPTYPVIVLVSFRSLMVLPAFVLALRRFAAPQSFMFLPTKSQFASFQKASTYLGRALRQSM